jgi:hypothetical protein
VRTLKCLSMILSLSLLTTATSFAEGTRDIKVSCNKANKSIYAYGVKFNSVSYPASLVLYETGIFVPNEVGFKAMPAQIFGSECKFESSKPMKMSCSSKNTATPSQEIIVDRVSATAFVKGENHQLQWSVGVENKSANLKEDLSYIVHNSNCVLKTF